MHNLWFISFGIAYDSWSQSSCLDFTSSLLFILLPNFCTLSVLLSTVDARCITLSSPSLPAVRFALSKTTATTQQRGRKDFSECQTVTFPLSILWVWMLHSSKFSAAKVKLSGAEQRFGSWLIIPVESFCFTKHSCAQRRSTCTNITYLQMLYSNVLLCCNYPFILSLPLPVLHSSCFRLMLLSRVHPRSREFKDFLKKALDKNPETRPTAVQLMEVGPDATCNYNLANAIQCCTLIYDGTLSPLCPYLAPAHIIFYFKTWMEWSMPGKWVVANGGQWHVSGRGIKGVQEWARNGGGGEGVGWCEKWNIWDFWKQLFTFEAPS